MSTSASRSRPTTRRPGSSRAKPLFRKEQTMQIGMMGLGRMGANMVRRLLRDGHQCVVYDINPASVATLVKDGAVGAASMEEFVGKLTKPRSAWLMLPAAITGKIVDLVAAL